MTDSLSDLLARRVPGHSLERPFYTDPEIYQRDLETICLKALEKDPAQRYAEAGSLARDLRRPNLVELPGAAHDARLPRAASPRRLARACRPRRRRSPRRPATSAANRAAGG